MHAYPQAFGIPFSNLGDYDNYTWINTYFIASRAALAKAANKPIILEEFGTVPQGQQSTPGSSSYTNNYGAGIVQSPRFVPSSQDVGPMPSIAAAKQVCINMYTTSLSGLAPIVLLTLQAAVATAVSLPAYDRIHSFKPLSLMFAMRTAMHALMHMTHSADAQNDYCLIAASIRCSSANQGLSKWYIHTGVWYTDLCWPQLLPMDMLERSPGRFCLKPVAVHFQNISWPLPPIHQVCFGTSTHSILPCASAFCLQGDAL